MTTAEDYADSSFLMSLLVEDGNTGEAKEFVSSNPVTLTFNPLHRLEVRNGLRLRVFRGEIDGSQCAAAMKRIEGSLAVGIFAHAAIPWTDALRQAELLSAEHAVDIGSRSADTLHVAAAKLSKARRFLSFDKRQRQLAKAAGLQVKP